MPTPIHTFHQQQSQSTFQTFGNTIHPAELSPTTESGTSVSPLAVFTDLSAAPRYVAQDQHWNNDSELAVHAHGMVDMDMTMVGIDGMTISIPPAVVGGMPMTMGDVGESTEEDAAGEEDAEGDEDWEHAHTHQTVHHQQQSQFQMVQHMQQQQHQQYMESDSEVSEADMQGLGSGNLEEQQQTRLLSPLHQQVRLDDSGESEVTGGESESEDSFLSEPSESEDDEDDPDDPEFVPRMRSGGRRIVQRHATNYTSGDHGLSTSALYQTFPFSSLAEGRTLRSRSSSARYNPYPSSYPSAEGLYTIDNDAFDNMTDEGSAYSEHRRQRHNSTSSSSSTHPPRSLSSLSNSSGVTTATSATTRRRLRPSNTLPVPVPVPNLTKKSRGRRVPTMSSLEDLRSASSGAGKKRLSAGGKMARMYLCDVEGCGKCFARGEHLKRHVRSIHTYEKRELFFFLLFLSFY